MMQTYFLVSRLVGDINTENRRSIYFDIPGVVDGDDIDVIISI